MGPKRGSFWATQNEPKFGAAPNSISPRRLGDRIRHYIRDPPGIEQRLPCTCLPKIFMPLGVVTIPIGSTSAKMAKIVHTDFGLAPRRRLLCLAHVVCEPWGPMSISPMSYMVHWSMRPACTRVLNMVHGGQKMWKIAQNGRKSAHSWLGQMRHMPDLDRSVP